jgi:protease IV
MVLIPDSEGVRMNNNNPGLWAIAGVVTGFVLPALIMVCISLACVGSLIAMSSNVGSTSGPGFAGPLSGPAVGIITVSGEITSGSSASLLGSSSSAASGDIIPLIEEAAADSEIKAILVDVNSPGGSVVPSDEIYHALKTSGKPVVIYMGDLAASGAFYISMAGDHIVANPNTLTGSIGVISEFPEASELMQKLGVSVTTVKSGSVKDMGSMYRPLTDDEKAYWQALINETYNGFVDIVAEGRHLPREKVLPLADGRVFTGRQALTLGLVDSLGYEKDAITKAAALGKISGTPRVVRYSPSSPLSSLFSGLVPPSIIPASFFNKLLMPTLEYRWVR